MADYTFSFNLANAPAPWTHPDLTILGDAVKIINGGFQDSADNGASTVSKVIYTAKDPVRTGNIASEIVLGNDVGDAIPSHIGPALLDPATGFGYYIRVVGAETRIFRVETQDGLGTYYSMPGNSPKYAGDRIKLEMTPSGVFNVYVNDNLEKTWSDPDNQTYRSTVYPAAISCWNGDADGFNPIVSLKAIGMAAGAALPSGDYVKSFAVPDVPAPWTDPDFVVLGDPVKISNGGLVDSVENNIASKVVYTAVPPDRTGNISSTITLAVDPAVLSPNTCAPALIDPVTGFGYLVKVVGNELRPFVANTLEGMGIFISTPGNSTKYAGDAIKLEMTPANVFNVYVNDVLEKSWTDTTGSNYHATVRPAMVSFASTTGDKYPISSFAASGLADDDQTQPVFDIINVNANNTITSKQQIVVNAQNGTLAQSASLSLSGSTYQLSIVSKTATEVRLAAIDIHNTPFAPGESITLSISDGTTSKTQTVVANSETGYIYTVASSIDAAEGLLKDFDEAVAGDGYDGQTTIAGSTIAYYAAGPHREIDPAVPNGTASIGWFFDASARTWQSISEVTNQGAEGDAPSWTASPTNKSAKVGTAFTYDLSSIIDGTRPINLRLAPTSTALPAGLSFAGETITGTPTTVTTSSAVRIIASNAISEVWSAPFSIVVTSSAVLLAPSWVQQPTPPSGTVGASYNYPLSGMISGTGPLTVTSVGTALPAGLSIVNNAIVGTPTTDATTTGIILRVTGAESPPADTSAFSIVVDPAEAPTAVLPPISRTYAVPNSSWGIESASNSEFTQTDTDKLDYAIDWSDWLQDDTIASAQWELVGRISSPFPPNVSGSLSIVWITGVAGSHTAKCHLVTGAGREITRSLNILIEDL